MPFHIKEEQKQFKFELYNGLPIAPVARMGTAYWVMCCGLCGCIHHLLNVPLDLEGGEFTPRCLLKTTHPASYAAWLKLHPDSAGHSKIALKLRSPITTIPLEAEKRVPIRRKVAALPAKVAA